MLQHTSTVYYAAFSCGMPKEQGHLGEWSTHRISKNAKDKSNRSILWASHGGIHRQQSGMGDVSGHMLHCHSEKDSEKDSGYSETGSDFVHTDVDDQRSSVSEPHRESSKTLDSNSVNGANNNITTYEELTPIYIFKNLVVKSSRPEQLLHGPLEWGGGWHSLTSGKAPTQLLLIQQPTVPTPASTTTTPLSCLAPPQAHSPYCLAPDCLSTRHRRFLNTAEILNQSGLLAITLRTKELLKQNAATEKEIAQLRHHTHLLCHVTQVRQNGSNEGSDSLDKLLQAMSESSSYPNLDLNHLKTLSSSCQQSKTRNEEDQEKDNIGGMNTHCSPIQVVSLHNIDDGTSPPSPLLAPSPDTEEIEYTDCPVDPMSTTINVYFPRSDPE
uniref:CLOCK-interacting pacemaker-like n=2 Tax=Acanthochromis polyacanthus TaxID=80966 RepID=A0A3Q1EJG8_9TELE